MILAPLKSIPAGFCKLNRRWSVSHKESSVFLVSIIFHTRTRKCTKPFTENITEYFVHVQTVYQASPRGGGGGGGGGEGPGDEAIVRVHVLLFHYPCMLLVVQVQNVVWGMRLWHAIFVYQCWLLI